MKAVVGSRDPLGHFHDFTAAPLTDEVRWVWCGECQVEWGVRAFMDASGAATVGTDSQACPCRAVNLILETPWR